MFNIDLAYLFGLCEETKSLTVDFLGQSYKGEGVYKISNGDKVFIGTLREEEGKVKFVVYFSKCKAAQKVA